MAFFLTPEGTRVVVLTNKASGVIVELRRERYLRPYVVKCDDGQTRYVSGIDLAREDDTSLTPLAT